MKKITKKLIAFLLSFILVFGFAPILGLVGVDSKISAFLKSGVFSLSVNAQTEDIYTYIISDNCAAITRCNPSTFGAIAIPGTLGGYPVTSIGDDAFAECFDLTSVTMPDSVMSLGDEAFAKCLNLASVTIPNSVMSIGVGVFRECRNLISMTIPDSVTNIRNGTFNNCISLTNITIPDSVTSIGVAAFQGCSSLTSVLIPNTVTSIEDGTFYDCSALESITMGNSLTKIGGYAFYGCSILKSITIPDSVTSIGDYAFNGCYGLTSITIPNSVTTIGAYAFYLCQGLTSAVIPSSVTIIGYSAFLFCDVMTIYCYTNSFAHNYAIDNSIDYQLIHIFSASEGPGCVFDYTNRFIYGFNEGMNIFDDYYETENGYESFYTPTQNGLGTGTIVRVTLNDVIIEEYTIIIFGDVNGDGNIDSTDAGKMVDYENFIVSWNFHTDSAYLKAADLNGDGVIDSIDAGIAMDVENNIILINQTIGLPYIN